MRYKPADITRSSRRIVHCVAQCQECDWKAGHYLTAAKLATQHVKETGHTVTVEQGSFYMVGLHGNLTMQ